MTKGICRFAGKIAMLALLLMAPTGAAWADQRECGNLLGMLRHLNAERSKEQFNLERFERGARHWADQLKDVSARADGGDVEARAGLPRLRVHYAHLLATVTESKEIVATAEKAITEVTFDISSKCPELLKSAPPAPPPQAAAAPPAPQPPVAPGPPNVGAYILKGLVQHCGNHGSAPVDFAINNGAVTGNTQGQRLTGTVDSEGILRVKLDGNAESAVGGRIIWQDGHWRAAGQYTFVTNMFTCSNVWSATQANPS